MNQRLSVEEFRALSYMAKSRREFMNQMFSGTKLTFGTTEKVKTAKDLASKAKSIGKKTKKLITGPGQQAAPALQKAAEEFIAAAADVATIADVVEVITGEVLSELIGEIVPYLGIVRSGFKAAQAGKAVAKDAYHLYKFDSYKQGFLAGDPQAAAEAVHQIIVGELARHSIQLVQQTTATAGKIAGILGDGGTATTAGIGAANALVSLGIRLTQLGVDIKQMKAGNERISQPNTLDLTVFKDAPILGCYMLTCADTFTVTNMFVADFGLPGWMDKVENMKKTQMDPLLKIASKYIQSSPLQLDNLASDKGTYTKKGFFAQKKSDAVKFVKSKFHA